MKIKTTLFFVFLSLILTSCKPVYPSNSTNANSDTLSTIETLPLMEEFYSWDTKAKYELKSEIESIPLSHCIVFFTTEVTEFLQDYSGIELLNLTIEQDNLSVISGKNKKSFFNLIFKVDIQFDTTKNVGSYELADEVSRKLITFLEQYSYYVLKTKEIDINTLDQNGYIIHNVNNTYSISNETVFIEQATDEYAVQTLAYDFFENIPYFQLQKFGILPESNLLLVEYRVDDDYFDFDDFEKSTKELESKGIELKEHLLSQEVTEIFIQSNHLEYLIISFHNDIFDESYLSFKYEV